MRPQRTYVILTSLVSILFGIILPLALDLRGFTPIAIFFTFVWFIYVVGLLLSTFVVKPGLRIKVIQRKNPTIVRYELRDSNHLE